MQPRPAFGSAEDILRRMFHDTMDDIQNNGEFLELIRKRAAQRVLFLPHAVRQMSRPERMTLHRRLGAS